jgi:hypothetical protein
VTPILTRTMLGVLQEGASIALRHGFRPAIVLNGGEANNFAATAVLPAGLGSSVNLTAGMVSQYCAGCSMKLMLGGGGDIRIGSTAFGTTPNAPRLTVSLVGELGYSQRDPGSYISGYVGAPVALITNPTRTPGMRFVPFVTPGFGFANITGAGAANGSGSRYLVGGGVALYNPASSVMVDVGFQYVAIPDTRTMFGLAVVLGR